MVYKDLCKFIKEENLSEIDNIINDLKPYVQNNDFLDKSTQDIIPLIKGYYSIACKYARKYFEEQSTCEFDNIEDTVPWKLGFIKAYCEMIFKKLKK